MVMSIVNAHVCVRIRISVRSAEQCRKFSNVIVPCTHDLFHMNVNSKHVFGIGVEKIIVFKFFLVFLSCSDFSEECVCG